MSMRVSDSPSEMTAGLIKKSDNFIAQYLNADIPDDKIKTHPFKKNVQYVPIDYVEMHLDRCFMGMWKTTEFQYSLITNEITGSILLSVFHPIMKVWIERAGAGAVPVQVNKGAPITDVLQKKADALTYNLPKLKAECIKNAAKSLGVSFGRHLNREHKSVYESLIARSSLDRKGDA